MTSGTGPMNNYGYLSFFNQSAVSFKEIRYWLWVGLATAAGYSLILLLLLSGRNTVQQTIPVASPQAMPFEVTLAQVNNVSPESQVGHPPDKRVPPEVLPPASAPQITAVTENRHQVTVKVAPVKKKESLKHHQSVQPPDRKSPPLALHRKAVSEIAPPLKKTPETSHIVEQKTAIRHEKMTGAISNIQNNEKLQWQSQLLMLLQKNMQYPPFALRMHQQDIVIISFTVNSAGEISDIERVRSHGYASLDRESLKLPERIGKVSPPPESLLAGKKSIRLTVPVNFIIH